MSVCLIFLLSSSVCLSVYALFLNKIVFHPDVAFVLAIQLVSWSVPHHGDDGNGGGGHRRLLPPLPPLPGGGGGGGGAGGGGGGGVGGCDG